MDPVTAIGLAASVLQVAATGVTVVHTLDTFRRNYAAAPESINALNTEVALISVSISEVKELFEERDQKLDDKLRAKPELSKALAVCLAGCDHILSSLDRDMKKIQQAERGIEGKFGLKRRASFLWKQDIFKNYLDQIHGHQSALNLLLQALQMRSLKEIEALLRKEKTRTILQEMSYDETTLRGSPSIPYLELSDTETELDMKVLDLEIYRQASDGNPEFHVPKPQSYEENLISFDDAPILHSSIQGPLSPAFEQMRMLDAQFDATDKRDGTSITVTSVEKEKHDSIHSIDRPRSLILNDPWTARGASDNLSPFSLVSSEPMTINRVDRSASTASSYAESSRTFASIESEFPEAVIMDSRVDPFPIIADPPTFLPIHWREEEVSLDAKRSHVLRSGNVEDQLHFAETALHFCTIAKHHNMRKSRLQKAPTEETDVQRMLQADAKQIVIRHARSGHAKALFLQSMYFDLDQVTACELQKVALANRYYRAAFYLGSMLEISKVTKKALGYYVEGADGGDSACQSRLADVYLKGTLGKRKDQEKAVKYLRQAVAGADRDYPQALYLLATLQTESYRRVNKIKESILPIDECAARENFRKAAQLGCANSQVVLGQAYSKARLGCAKNPAIALHYFRIAARQGVPAADHEISTLFGFAKHGDIVTPNGFLAFKHARRAAEDGNIPSFWQVGHFYEKGVGVKPSFPKAREWYLKGAARQDENCMMALDSLKSLSFGAT